MDIVILGAGQVGRTIAEQLLTDKSLDLALVDINNELIEDLSNRFQAKCVLGHAAHPDVLRKAELEDAYLLIAVTGSDEVNMVACQVAYTLFSTPSRIARIRSDVYSEDEELFKTEHMPIQEVINPEQVVTDQILQLIEHPGTTQVLQFSDGAVCLIAVKSVVHSVTERPTLAEINGKLKPLNAKVAALYRDNQVQIPVEDTLFSRRDELFVVTPVRQLDKVVATLHVDSGQQTKDKRYRRVVIAGGGNIGLRLAHALENQGSLTSLKVIEFNKARAIEIAKQLQKTTVMHGSATDRVKLEEYGIGDTDLFCAVTNDDEVNVMSALLAKKSGVRQAISLIGNTAYVDLVDTTNIDVTISPQQSTASTILRHVRRAGQVRVHPLKHGAAEILEIVARGDRGRKSVIGKRLSELAMPPGATVLGTIRNQELFLDQSVTINADDHLIVFLADKNEIKAVEKMFKPNQTFFA